MFLNVFHFIFLQRRKKGCENEVTYSFNLPLGLKPLFVGDDVAEDDDSFIEASNPPFGALD